MRVERHRVNAAVHRPGWAWARRRGIDAARLLAGTGLDADQIEAPDCLLTTAQHVQFLHNLIDLAQEPALGLLIGSTARLPELGMLGLTMLSAPTIGQALAAGARFARLGGSLGEIGLRHEGARVVLVFSLPPLSPELQHYLVEDFFAAVDTYISTLLGVQALDGRRDEQSAAPTDRQKSSSRELPRNDEACFGELRLAYPPPAHALVYSARFRCPIRFDAIVNEAVLDAQLLERAPPLADALAYEQGIEACALLTDRLREDSAIEQAARQLLARDPAGCTSVTILAARLDLPRRTLQRRLAEAGTSFSVLQADVRKALACDLLRNPALSIAEVAGLLGYGEPGNFGRAFRQWTGCAPSAFRRLQS